MKGVLRVSRELPKTYDPKAVEDKIYSNWVDKGYFHTKIDKNKHQNKHIGLHQAKGFCIAK